MTELRIAHIIQRGTQPPEKAQKQDTIWKYGCGTAGIIDRIIIHDEPENDLDHEWLRDYALNRLAPGGTKVTMIRLPSKQGRKQCPEGLIMREPAYLNDGQRSLVGERTEEYRCQLREGHGDQWHQDDDKRWQTY